jgi:hypothetical protein
MAWMPSCLVKRAAPTRSVPIVEQTRSQLEVSTNQASVTELPLDSIRYPLGPGSSQVLVPWTLVQQSRLEPNIEPRAATGITAVVAAPLPVLYS